MKITELPGSGQLQASQSQMNAGSKELDHTVSQESKSLDYGEEEPVGVGHRSSKKALGREIQNNQKQIKKRLENIDNTYITHIVRDRMEGSDEKIQSEKENSGTNKLTHLPEPFTEHNYMLLLTLYLVYKPIIKPRD